MHLVVLKELYQRLQMNQTHTVCLKRSLDFIQSQRYKFLQVTQACNWNQCT